MPRRAAGAPAGGEAVGLAAGQVRTAVWLALAGALCWLAFVAVAAGFGGPASHRLMMLMMPATGAWSPATVAAVFGMWALMMAAMMLPSALPMATSFAALDRGPAKGGGRTAGFVLAYLAVWVGFSLAATALQWWLQGLGLVNAGGASRTPLLAGGLLLVAGAVQFTPLKRACLRKCRTPLGFLATEWRAGFGGAAVMGLRHGAFCLGCCWALMLLPFVAGTMNLLWMAGLAAVVALEKLAPRGELLSRGFGVLLVAAGLATLATAI